MASKTGTGHAGVPDLHAYETIKESTSHERSNLTTVIATNTASATIHSRFGPPPAPKVYFEIHVHATVSDTAEPTRLSSSVLASDLKFLDIRTGSRMELMIEIERTAQSISKI
eukprot:scpid109844/ scgid14774/ 